ncbi:MAG: hypothetical protein J1F25_06830 [Prevotellaceae bacterium]|nr:hypothetical protein [Prevotellaceae bacterium]
MGSLKTDDIDKIIAEALEQEKGKRRRRKTDSERTQKRERMQRIRTILNTLFLLAFAATILLYILLPNDRTAFFCVGFGALLLKVVEFVLRFMF